MGRTLSYVLNLILILAVIPLYIFHFSGNGDPGRAKKGKASKEDQKKTAENKGDSTTTDQSSSIDSGERKEVPTGNLKIAYLNWDTLLTNYEYVEDMQEDLSSERLSMQENLRNRMKKFESEYKKLQEEAVYMTQEELQKARQDMQQKQQDLRKKQQGLSTRLAKKEQKMMKKFFDNVNDFLADYNEEHNFDLILKFQRGGDLLYGDQSYNITDDVLKGLNNEYRKEKGSS